MDAPLLLEEANPAPSPLLVQAQQKAEEDEAPSAPVEGSASPTEDADFASRWREMIAAIEQERIAIAAFLTEGTPHLSGDTVTIVFHPDYAFHKESLEKSENLQYLAGMVHRHLGDRFHVDVQFDDGAKRKPSSREKLREKAQLVCQVFDGKIVKEE